MKNQMEKSATEIIEFLIAKYPKSVAEIYRKHGIYNKLPDVQTTIDMYIVYGDPFLMELYNLYHRETSNFLGLFGSKPGLFGKKQNADPIEEKKEKGAGWEKFKNIFGGLIGLGGASVAAYKAKQAAGTPGADPEDEELILGMSKNVFYAAVVVVVVIIIIAVVNATKKGG